VRWMMLDSGEALDHGGDPLRVHSSPTNPFAVAPSSSACSIVASWASDSLGAGPLGPRLCSASGPPRCQRACQTLTAWAETPS